MPQLDRFVLSQSFANSVKANGKKQRFPDHKVKGLALRVGEGGTKNFVIRYRSEDGRSREMKIGRADQMPLEQARKVAREQLAMVPNGADPLKKRREARSEASTKHARTLAAVTEQYRQSSDYLSKRVTTRATYDNSLDRHILPRLGNHPIESIKRGVVSGLLNDLASEGSGNISNQARSALSVVMSFAMERDLIEFNPVRGVKSKHQTAVRERLLSDTELRAVWCALEDGGGVSPTVADMVRLCMFLPARSREIAGMEWSEVDFENALWVVPGERMKGHSAHELPLPEPVMSLLKARRRETNLPWVFPNKAGSAPMDRARPSRACNRLAKELEIPNFGPHDLRRTIATRMAEMGIESAIIERCLGHKVGAGRAIVHYDHHNYRERKREALEMWESELVRTLNG